MELTRRSLLFLWLALIDVAIFLPLALFQDMTLHGVGNPVNFPQEPQKLWFSSEGDLFAVFAKGLVLEIQKFSENNNMEASWKCRLSDRLLIPGSVTAPLGIGRKDDRALTDLAARGDKREVSSSALQYAISKDGQRMAWAWEGKLHLASLPELCSGKPGNAEFTPTALDPKPLAGLQLLGGLDRPTVLEIFDDGGIHVERSAEDPTDLSLRNPFKPSDLFTWLLPTNPSDISTLSAKDSPIIAFVDQGTKPSLVTLNLGITNPAAIHRLSESEILVGTDSGVLIHLEGIGYPSGSTIYTVPATQAIHAITSYSSNDTIVGGDFRDLVWIRKDRTIRTIATTPRFVTGLAVSKNRLAYSYSKGMSLADLTWSPRFSDAGRSKISWMLSIVGILGFLRAICADRKSGKKPAIVDPKERQVNSERLAAGLGLLEADSQRGFVHAADATLDFIVPTEVAANVTEEFTPTSGQGEEDDFLDVPAVGGDVGRPGAVEAVGPANGKEQATRRP